jgi:predicted nucleotidyltransferase
MGKIFTPEEIREERYPQDGAHKEAAEELRRSCAALQPEYPAISSACVYGSVALGLANRRSDIDGVCLLDSNEDGVAVRREIAGLERRAEALYATPVDMSVWRADEWRKGLGVSAGDYLFLEHICPTAASTPYRLGEPAEVLYGAMRFSNAAGQLELAHRSAAAYLANKAQFFTYRMSHDKNPDDRAVTLQRAYELPSALGRKLLRLDFLAEWRRENDTPHILGSSPEQYGRPLLATGFTALLDGDTKHLAHALTRNDSEYDEVLEDAIDGRKGLAGYGQYLADCYGQSVEYALGLTLAAQEFTDKQFAEL